MSKQDKVTPKRKGEAVRDAREDKGAARRAIAPQILDTAIPAPKKKASKKHDAD